MKCKCGKEMEGVGGTDNPFPPDGEEYAFNLYLCNRCGTVCKQDVWVGKGLIWIDCKNNITREPLDQDDCCY